MNYIINLLGSPGVGKSTMAAELFAYMKKNNFIVEYINEFAKDLVYKNSISCLKNQIYVSGIQHHKIWTILKYYKDNNVDKGFIITDSPLILGLLYKDNNPNPYFDNFILEEFNNFYPFKIKNLNYLIKPNFSDFEELGRCHSKEESNKIYKELKNILNKYNISYFEGNYEKVIKQIKKDISNIIH